MIYLRLRVKIVSDRSKIKAQAKGNTTMATRETNRRDAIEKMAKMCSEKILKMKIGEIATIVGIVGNWYGSLGYENIWLDLAHGYVWTKDRGATFAIAGSDMFAVYQRVLELLEGKRKLDFGMYLGMYVGSAENVPFRIQNVENPEREDQ